MTSDIYEPNKESLLESSEIYYTALDYRLLPPNRSSRTLFSL